MNARFAQNPDYVECETRLKHLHRLIAKGEGDTEEADTLRDEMDRFWFRLTPEENARLSGLSADLYMLQDKEQYEQDASGGWTPEHLREEIGSAIQHKAWAKVLEMLRKGPTGVPPHGIAWTRAQAYEELGHLDTALLFIDYAIQQHPQEAVYKFYKVTLLDQLGRTSEAMDLAGSILDDTEIAPVRSLSE